MIDLRENSLIIGTNNTKTRFLSEAELPSYGRLHDPNAPPGAPTDTPKEGGQVAFCGRHQPCKSPAKKTARKTTRSSQEQSTSGKDENVEQVGCAGQN